MYRGTLQPCSPYRTHLPVNLSSPAASFILWWIVRNSPCGCNAYSVRCHSGKHSYTRWTSIFFRPLTGTWGMFQQFPLWTVRYSQRTKRCWRWIHNDDVYSVCLFGSSRRDTQNPLTMLPSRRTSPLTRHSRGNGAAWSSDIETLDPLHEPELRFSSDRNGPTSTVCSGQNVSRPLQPYVPSTTASQRLQQTHDDLFQL